MDGNALEIALGLIRHPANRAPLRLRPLPKGVGELIELAAGVPARVAEAAALSGEPPHQVREAARFYVREVLLFPGADAYRVLGVSETASSAQIKLHYRRLQHWLHPDRRGNDWESVFATRINQAWGELRSPARRTAYDARHAQPMLVDEGPVAQTFVVDGWRPVLGPHAPDRRWILPTAAVAGCLGLVLLVALREEPPPPTWDVASDRPGQVEPQSLADVAIAAMESMRARLREDLDPVEPVDVALAPAGDAQAVGQEPAPDSTSEAADPPGPARTTRQARDMPPAQAAETAERAQGTAAGARDRTPASATDSLIVAGDTAAFEASSLAMPPAEREQLARERGRQLIRYLGSGSDHAPPIWNSLDALDAATALRGRLDEGGPRLFRKVRFSDPEWRITNDRASMTSTIRRRVGQSGALKVDLVWRDGVWLVDRVQADRI